MVHKVAMLSVFCMVVGTMYAWDAQEYQESNIGQFRHAIKELHKLSLKGDESILDIGCGDGKISRYIAKEFVPRGKLVGVDNDASMLALAQSHREPAHAAFVYGDAMTYASEQKYDVVVSFWCLHWVPDYDAALKNIAQLLRPGGKALLCHIVDYHPLEKWMQHTLALDEWKHLQSRYINLMHQPSFELVMHAIRASGLTVEHVEFKKNGEWMPVELKKKNHLSTPRFDFIPQEQREQFCDDMLKGYISEYPLNEDGEIYYWVPVAAMVLQKSRDS